MVNKSKEELIQQIEDLVTLLEKIRSKRDKNTPELFLEIDAMIDRARGRDACYYQRLSFLKMF